MRFLKADASRELHLTKDLETPPAPYAILSHTWGSDDDEVTYHDVQSKMGTHKTGYNKLQFCANQAERDMLEYFWVDTCCIDKANHSELSEAITSMFRWYQGAAKCYVYLSDVSVKNSSEKNVRQAWEAAFRCSKWFTRGWTLQELLAPTSVDFFSREGICLGDKQTLEGLIQEITSIPTDALRGVALSTFTVEERLRWAEGRHTKKVEDKAYSLLGMFGVFMALIYGEGDNAHKRLRREIEAGMASPSAVIPFNRDADFVERGTILDQIHNRFMVSGSWVALAGLGGVGKSQLAIEYAYRSQERLPLAWVFWVYASNAARLEQSYRDMANCVKIPGRQNMEADIFQLMYDWLHDKQKGRWVVILDNVDDAGFLFEARSQGQKGGTSQNVAPRPLISYLPQCSHGSVLVTTRTQQAALKLVEPRNIINIQPMSKADALTLLEKKLGEHYDECSAPELAAVLECMPLAIVQAAAYITQRAPRCSVQQYLEEFQKSDRKRTSLLSREGGQLRRDVEAKNSIFITWQISFNRIGEIQQSAADLLALMSFFDRQGIPEVLLYQRTAAASISSLKYKANSTHNANQATMDDDDSSTDDERSTGGNDKLEDDIAMLRSYSFIAATKTGAGFRMHRLVQLATQKWLESHGQKERWQQISIQILNSEFPSGEYENWIRCQPLFPHVKLAAAQKPKEYDSLVEWASLLFKASWYALETGKWGDAERMSSRSMKVRERVLGAEHPDTLTSMANLASTYWNQGRWKEAEELFVQVKEISVRVLGEEHPSTLTSMANLASTYSNQGRWKEAEELFVQVKDIRTRVLGEEHPSTLTSMANLASTYRNQGRWKEAEELEVQVKEIRTRVLGEEHPSTLTSMANLASTYRNQGRWKEAEELEVQVKEISVRVLGEEHPSTLTSMANLASTYSNQGRWKEAEELEVRVKEIRTRVLGEEHPSTLTSMANLASTYSNQGRWKEAEELEVRVKEIRTRVLGEEHPSTLTSMANLAHTRKQQGQFDEAIALLSTCLELRMKVLGSNHPHTCAATATLQSWSEEEGLDLI